MKIRTTAKKIKKDNHGVSMTETVMLVTLIAIVAISSIKFFTLQLGDSFCDSAVLISNAENVIHTTTEVKDMEFIPNKGCEYNYKSPPNACPGGGETCSNSPP